jgi:hypothetical protein
MVANRPGEFMENSSFRGFWSMLLDPPSLRKNPRQISFLKHLCGTKRSVTRRTKQKVLSTSFRSTSFCTFYFALHLILRFGGAEVQNLEGKSAFYFGTHFLLRCALFTLIEVDCVPNEVKSAQRSKKCFWPEVLQITR